MERQSFVCAQSKCKLDFPFPKHKFHLCIDKDASAVEEMSSLDPTPFGPRGCLNSPSLFPGWTLSSLALVFTFISCFVVLHLVCSLPY